MSDLSRKIAEAINASEGFDWDEMDLSTIADLIDHAGLAEHMEEMRVLAQGTVDDTRTISRLKGELATAQHAAFDLQQRIEAAVALHYRKIDSCETCGGYWPCLTVQRLRGREESAPPYLTSGTIWELAPDALEAARREEENEMAAHFSELIAEREDLRFRLSDAEARIEAALCELGVPDDSYPAPVANAVRILRGEE